MIKILPTEYTEYDFIQSTGTQWIDSLISIKANTWIDATVEFTSMFDYNMMFGAWAYLALSLRGENVVCAAGGGVETQNIGSSTTEKMRYRIQLGYNKGYTQDGTKYTLGSEKNTATDRHILLFAASASADNTPYAWTSYGVGKIYNLMIYEGTNKVAHFVPCKRNEDSVIGMYDIVRKQFFINSATDESVFSAGTIKDGVVKEIRCKKTGTNINIFKIGDTEVWRRYYKVLIKTNNTNYGTANMKYVYVPYGSAYSMPAVTQNSSSTLTFYKPGTSVVASQASISSIKTNAQYAYIADEINGTITENTTITINFSQVRKVYTVRFSAPSNKGYWSATTAINTYYGGTIALGGINGGQTSAQAVATVLPDPNTATSYSRTIYRQPNSYQNMYTMSDWGSESVGTYKIGTDLGTAESPTITISPSFSTICWSVKWSGSFSKQLARKEETSFSVSVSGTSNTYSYADISMAYLDKSVYKGKKSGTVSGWVTFDSISSSSAAFTAYASLLSSGGRVFELSSIRQP